jgi:hypothetical protein
VSGSSIGQLAQRLESQLTVQNTTCVISLGRKGKKEKRHTIFLISFFPPSVSVPSENARHCSNTLRSVTSTALDARLPLNPTKFYHKLMLAFSLRLNRRWKKEPTIATIPSLSTNSLKSRQNSTVNISPGTLPPEKQS